MALISIFLKTPGEEPGDPNPKYRGELPCVLVSNISKDLSAVYTNLYQKVC